MWKETFHLNQATQGTIAGPSHRTIISLPEGSEIVPIRQVPQHPEMIEVLWEGQSVWLFAIDFDARTKDGSIPQPLARAALFGDGTPSAEASTDTEVNSPVNLEAESFVSNKETTRATPKVRRFNASGRELL